MYEYKIVRIKINAWTGKPEQDYREVIKQYAEAGWRLVQVFQKITPTNAYGAYFDVIFERPKDNYV